VARAGKRPEEWFLNTAMTIHEQQFSKCLINRGLISNSAHLTSPDGEHSAAPTAIESLRVRLAARRDA
jgi:hypothetical protein